MITFQFKLYLDPADLHVLPRGQRREERVELRHHPDGATRVDAPHVRSGVVATYDDIAAGWYNLAGYGADERGFAGAVMTQKPDDFPSLDRKGHPIHRKELFLPFSRRISHVEDLGDLQ